MSICLCLADNINIYYNYLLPLLTLLFHIGDFKSLIISAPCLRPLGVTILARITVSTMLWFGRHKHPLMRYAMVYGEIPIISLF
jgi:hypothetical protein